VPELRHGLSLAEAIALLPLTGTRIALDNYEAAAALSGLPVPALPATLAVGAERGWSDGERALLRAHGFALAHLGTRVLRTETACIAAITLLKAKLGLT
jgi:RsmE family RNA methyltransferase